MCFSCGCGVKSQGYPASAWWCSGGQIGRKAGFSQRQSNHGREKISRPPDLDRQDRSEFCKPFSRRHRFNFPGSLHATFTHRRPALQSQAEHTGTVSAQKPARVATLASCWLVCRVTEYGLPAIPRRGSVGQTKMAVHPDQSGFQWGCENHCRVTRPARILWQFQRI